MQPHSRKPLQDIDDVWAASELATSQVKVVPTGSAQLDSQLPGGGWPAGALVEILQTPGTQCEWRLLLPGLAQTSGVLALVGAAHAPFAAALAGQGLNPQRLPCINTELPAHRLWACEQALRCKDVGVVLAWLTLALLARPALLAELLGDVLDSQPDRSNALDSTAAAAA